MKCGSYFLRQGIYIALKRKMESRVQYVLEPARGPALSSKPTQGTLNET